MWLINSMSKWEKLDETPYLVEIHESDRIREEGFDSGSSTRTDSEESSEESASDDETDSKPASQEEPAYDDGVIPDDVMDQEGRSPVDLLQSFDWSLAEDDLDEFLGSDAGNSDSDSDSGSVTSDASRGSRASTKSPRTKKRKFNEAAEEDENSDEESTLAKKQRIANSRSSGLQNVKTPNSTRSENSLPTPGVTGDEDGGEDGGGDGDDGSFEDDLEADLMAEFDRQE